VWVPGPDWKDGKSRPHRDSIPDRPASTQSLYRLSYPAHTLYSTKTILTSHVRIDVTRIIQGVSGAVDITVGDDILGPCDKKISYRHGSYSLSLCCWGFFLIPVKTSQLTLTQPL